MSAGVEIPEWIKRHFPSLKEISALPASGQKHVYFADEEGKPIVLKTFRADARDERSVREIEMASRIKCRRVPTMLSHGAVELDGGKILWLKEQRLPGHALRASMGGARITAQTAYVLCDHVLEALESAEALRVVHRDVKPENIILSIDHSEAWLIDFGIARELDRESVTGTDNVFGPCTFGYASPEQIHNRKGEIDSRSDLFSLAVTVYEAVEGHNPFRDGANGPLDIADRTQNRPLPRLASIDNKGFVDLIEAMSRARRDHRPSTVGEARTWLKDVVRTTR